MLILDYSPDADGATILRDTEVEPYVISTIAKYTKWNESHPDQPFYVIVANEPIVQMFRVAVKEKMISSSQIEIRFNGQPLIIDEFGRLDPWPTGFCDLSENLCIRLLGWD